LGTHDGTPADRQKLGLMVLNEIEVSPVSQGGTTLESDNGWD